MGTVEPQYNVPRDWQLLLRQGFINLISKLFSIHFTVNGAKNIVHYSRTLFYRGLKGSTVCSLCKLSPVPSCSKGELWLFHPKFNSPEVVLPGHKLICPMTNNARQYSLSVMLFS